MRKHSGQIPNQSAERRIEALSTDEKRKLIAKLQREVSGSNDFALRRRKKSDYRSTTGGVNRRAEAVKLSPKAPRSRRTIEIHVRMPSKSQHAVRVLERKRVRARFYRRFEVAPLLENSLARRRACGSGATPTSLDFSARA